ncbi:MULTISPECIES: acetate/propionate family kinase [Collinsella]|uniref:acetate/propionate family kinase n=1 Tax=Collinsella TaxID=102106 RepID=UPI000B37D8FF|nr:MULTISPECIES: acetate kinase [Collinsella]MBM6907180.1 acetate kinase [Collinsella intestinalis]MBM6941910.1 acetate kinase [Collinsella intestinalis]MDM8163925.1 acetate kinase [Collinsella intestinalis]OUO63582.1 acetate kinase [Collinsella sp. An268]
MNVLVVNAGSSTLKYQLIDTQTHKVSAKGSCERVGFTGGTFTHTVAGEPKVTDNVEFPDHKVAIEVVLKDLEAHNVKIDGIGHRIVQGGWYFGDSTLVDADILAKIREVAPLAPLHNNPEANVIEYCLEQYPDLPNVTVYDTAFHFNMPAVAQTYSLPREVCDKLHIRKYGAHGTSYRYISKKVDELTCGKAHKVVICHIGSGASLAAVEDGKCMDTTMGLTPLDGVMMGTRCGSIDPATVCYLQREGGYTFDEVDDMMNKKSGLLAIAGTNDIRDIEQGAADGDAGCKLALDMFIYKIAAKVAEMATAMCGMDTLVFTAGIGEHAPAVRAGVADRLAWMGVKMDHAKNALRADGGWCLSTEDSPVTIYVIPTDEEYMIAADVERIVSGK